MAKIKLIIDTDILIDYLKGIKPAKELFNSNHIELYCSILSKKELLSKPGLSNAERKKVLNLFVRLKILKLDDDILAKYSLICTRYGEAGSSLADNLIAATAWSKNLPLLTRNLKHFNHIKEIQLAPVYKIS